MPALLRTQGLTRRFPGTVALDDVDFEVVEGEVHVLFGENGAGKSTMLNILAGALRPSEGQVFLHGEPVMFNSVLDARRVGISAVFQEFSLAPDLTVEANLELGAEPVHYGLIDRGAIRANAKELLDRLGFDIDTGRLVGSLIRAEQQMVEIAKALRTTPTLLILDEPTASLTEAESEQLFDMISALTEDGIGIIYVTHRLAEIERLADRVTVLRDGHRIGTIPAAEVNHDRLVEMMSGKQLDRVFPERVHGAGEVVVEAVNLSCAGVNDATFTVRAGEVVGFAGLLGSGKSSAGRALAGIVPITGGTATVKSQPVDSRPVAMLDRGVHYVPPDRKAEGLLLPRGVRENLSIPAISVGRFVRAGLIQRTEERSRARDVVARLSVKAGSGLVASMSGGNQQKVLIGRSLMHDVDLLILDEPTVGVDVGTRSVLYDMIMEFATQGGAVVLISSDLAEILHLPTRVYAFHRGRIRAELPASELTEKRLLSNFMDSKAAAA